MNARQIAIAVVAAAAIFWLNGQQQAEPPAPDPAKPAPVNPAPCPGPGPCPAPKPDPKPRKPWGATEGSSVGEQVAAAACKCCPQCKCALNKCPCRVVVGGRCSRSCECGAGQALIEQRPVGKISLGGPVAPDGKTEVQVDLPIDQRIKNIGSKKDGAGMCVMSSAEMAARWAALEQLRGLRDWCAQFPGGGYPSKVDKQLKEYCQAKGIPCPDYIQYEGGDPAILELALKTGRLAAVTYSGKDGVRYKGPIAHMVCLAHFDSQWACVLDNNGNHPNGVGENELLWMTPEEFLSRWKGGGGGGWAFVWLDPGPPPVPRNR